MAVYVPAGNWERAAGTCRIAKTEEKDGHTRYIIEINVPPYKWHVSRRYRQFVELHEKIVKSFSLDKNLLPPKKVFGNRTETFINERQKALEFYLHTVIHQFSLLPEPLAKFLDFQKYEIRGIAAALAETFFSQGDIIMSKLKMYEFSPMQLHAITQRLKLSEPTCYTNNPKQDIAHLVEFITQLRHLKIIGSIKFFEDSNIVPNSLHFDLSLFKYLDMLEIIGYNLDDNSICIDALRKKLKYLVIHESMKKLSTILLSGIMHWSPNTTPSQNWPVWQLITYANFSHNSLTKIDPSIKLLVSVTVLDFSHNQIEIIENLETLSDLSNLILSHNNIENIESLHTRLGNIHSLYLSSNKIKVLQGLSKLFSVAKLDLEGNFISSMAEITHLSKLPCLELLNLQRNPVTLHVDYRSQVLLIFGSRASEIELDGLKPTEKEIDTVSVLQALKQARGEYKSPPNAEDGNVETSGVKTSVTKDSHASSSIKDGAVGGKKSSKQLVNNLAEASKFRQQVEALRRIGGSDWLRLLNEMNSSSEGASKFISERCLHAQRESTDLQLHALPAFDKDISQLSAQHIKALAISSEISYPECISLLDNTNESFKHQFIAALIKHRAYSENKNESIKQIHGTYSSLLPEAKLLWMVLLESVESSVSEIPVCVVLFHSEIILLKVRSFSKNISSDNCCDTSLFPDFSYLRSILPNDIMSTTLGPCHAYIDVKVKISNGSETLTFLFNNMEMAELFISYMNEFYSITPLYKLHPFTNKTLAFEDIHAGLSLSHVSFKNDILFSQRVLVSKILHKCHYGILHYVFITPSHVVLVEERLHIPQVVGLDTTAQPQFHICALVSVHTNIKQIHLKDIDESDNSNDDGDETTIKQDSLVENRHLEVLYKCGSWLIIEFESGVVLYLKFFALKQRNEFLDAFLCARSQR